MKTAFSAARRPFWFAWTGSGAFFLSLLILSACEPAEIARPAYSIEGTYKVEEPNPKDNYVITLRKNPEHADGYIIDNLANVVKTPILGYLNGKKLIIPAQGIKGPFGSEQTLSGEAEKQDEVLVLHYSIKGPDGYNGAVYAKKQ
ncbi:hypothetical protein [Larkinella soli]|uniref:hypothetical protein n=1 Tax=Larkinella soli TaxID=1770527 RepID=UPI000FFB4A43|nr:hypothetical protein [Larkinella soli]